MQSIDGGFYSEKLPTKYAWIEPDNTLLVSLYDPSKNIKMKLVKDPCMKT